MPNADTTQSRPLGKTGINVFPLGLGCMGMSDAYGPSDEAESRATLFEAIDSGINLLDTGDFYGTGHNELLIRDALRERRREDVILSVKFGAMRDPDGRWSGFDGRPVAVKNFLAYSLKRLDTDYIDIYRPARLDATVPIEDTIGAIARMVKLGHVRHIGLSEVGAETIRRAHAVHPIADVQIEYSLISRGVENEILATCRELGISITAYGVLSRGLLSGHWAPDRELAKNDFRKHSPRFSKDNLQKNLALTEALAALAEQHGASTAQLAIAWVLSRGEDIIPLIGARQRKRLQEALGALHVSLTPHDLAAIENAVPLNSAVGTRYDAAAMTHLDSER